MFNVLWRRATFSAVAASAAPRQAARCRFASTATFVPPESLNGVDDLPPQPPARAGKQKPASSTFYTGRANFYDQVESLEEAVSVTRQALKALQLNPLPKFARDALPPPQPVWKDRLAMRTVVRAPLSTTRYRRVISLLNVLEDYRRVATTAGVLELVAHISGIVSGFEKENKEAVLARGKRKPVSFDQYGRTYTIGRRKESSARIWMIPVQIPPMTEVQSVEEPRDNDLAPFLPVPLEKPAPRRTVTTTSILINNTPLNEYFPSNTDRERVIRPLKVAGLLGAYNVFVLARGGGTTGQSGAISLGIAKAVAAHVPDVEAILRRAKLMRRDPRMVERKKTGLAKARKAYTWVKR